MLDFDLAKLYQLETRALKQAVRRNLFKFPVDFMFILNEHEVFEIVSQNVIPSTSHTGGGSPMVFTELGVAMLSSVLKTKKAIEVNIAIMRAFVFIRQYALSHKDLTQKLQELEQKYDTQFKNVYEAINFLIQENNPEEIAERQRVGFKVGEEV